MTESEYYRSTVDDLLRSVAQRLHDVIGNNSSTFVSTHIGSRRNQECSLPPLPPSQVMLCRDIAANTGADEENPYTLLTTLSQSNIEPAAAAAASKQQQDELAALKILLDQQHTSDSTDMRITSIAALTDTPDLFDAAAALKSLTRLSKELRAYSTEIDKELTLKMPAQCKSYQASSTAIKKPNKHEERWILLASSRLLDAAALCTRRRLLVNDIITFLTLRSSTAEQQQQLIKSIIRNAEQDDTFYHISSSVSQQENRLLYGRHSVVLSTPAVVYQFLQQQIERNNRSATESAGSSTGTRDKEQRVQEEAALRHLGLYVNTITRVVGKIMGRRLGLSCDSTSSLAAQLIVACGTAMHSTTVAGQLTITRFLSEYNAVLVGLLSLETGEQIDRLLPASGGEPKAIAPTAVNSENGQASVTAADGTALKLPTAEGVGATPTATTPQITTTIDHPVAVNSSVDASSYSAAGRQQHAQEAQRATQSSSPPSLSPYELPPVDLKNDHERLLWRRLLRFYQYYNVTEKLPMVGDIVRQYSSHEHQLFDALVEKYGPEPTPQQVDTMLLARQKEQETTTKAIKNAQKKAAEASLPPQSIDTAPKTPPEVSRSTDEMEVSNLSTASAADARAISSSAPREAPHGVNTIRKLCTTYGVTEAMFRDLNKDVLPAVFDVDAPIPTGTRLLVPMPENDPSHISAQEPQEVENNVPHEDRTSSNNDDGQQQHDEKGNGCVVQ